MRQGASSLWEMRLGEIGGWIDESFHCVGVIRQPQMGCMYSEDQPPGPSSVHCHRAM